MKRNIIIRVMMVIIFILLLANLIFKIDWLLIASAITTGICIVLSFSLKDKKE